MSPARILVVDDNPINLKLVAELLAWEGHQMITAVCADSARRVLRGPLPDLILMDIALPGIDGLTLTRQLKNDPRTRNIHVVALTAFAMRGDKKKALDAGCDGYITKPIDTRELPRLVAEFLAAGAPKTRSAGG